MRDKGSTLTQKCIESYAAHLREQERAKNTVQKYIHDLAALREWLEGRPLEKATLIEWKEHLITVYAAVCGKINAPRELSLLPGPGDLLTAPISGET